MTQSLKVLPLGGLGEIGKNMTILEYGEEIIVIDAGIMFPENDMLGIDLIIPDFRHLEGKFDKITGIFVTHGHEDHIGAISHLLKRTSAPVFGTRLTLGMIEKKLREAKMLHEADLRAANAGDTIKLGHFTIEPFHVTHSIPDCVGFGITTPVGLIVHTGDYKFDQTPADNWPTDYAKLAEFSSRGVLCLMADSTNADKSGWTASERSIEEGFKEVFRTARGRIIFATFSSLISRIQQISDIAMRYGRQVAIVGRSMRENTKIARRLGYLDIPDGLIVDIDQAKKMPAKKIVILATGAQGEPSAVMGRLANGRHRQLRIKEGDTVVFSAHAIPGNEELVYRTINRLYQRGATVLYDKIANVHVSGHASREEMKLMLNLVRPKFFVPVHGELRHLKLHGKMAEEMGIPKKNIAVIENGTPLELTPHRLTVMPRLTGGYVFVDGGSVGDTNWSVVRDRERLSQGGFFFVVVPLNGNGQLRGEMEFVTRGFVDKRGQKNLLLGAEKTIETVLRSQNGKSNGNGVEGQIRGALKRYLYEETRRRPMLEVVVT